jgi:hypothetical protein
MSLNIFDGPIPGQSLTQEPGSAPYERPPQYANVEEALEVLFDKLSSKRQATRLVLLLKKGVPVEYLTRTILFEGFLQNKWTPDVALLMSRILMAMIISIGTQANVKNMVIFNPDKEQEDFLEQFLDDADLFGNEEEETTPPEFTGLFGVKM